MWIDNLWRAVHRPHLLAARTLMPVAGVMLLAVLGADAGDARAAFPGENGRIAYAKDGAIFRIDSNGSDRDRLTDPQRSSDRHDFDGHPMYGPDGGKIVFVRTSCRLECNRSEVFMMDGDGSDRKRLTSSDGFELFASFSPSGRKIVFVRNGKLFKMRQDGNRVERLTEDIQADAPVWSPLGDEIAFQRPSSAKGEPSDIYTIGTEGGAVTNITKTPEDYEQAPDWSPDGSALVVDCGPQHNGLCRVAADGTGISQVITLDQGDEPVFSPSGNRIAYADFDENFERRVLKTIRADGSAPRTTDRPGNLASWQPR